MVGTNFPVKPSSYFVCIKSSSILYVIIFISPYEVGWSIGFFYMAQAKQAFSYPCITHTSHFITVGHWICRVLSKILLNARRFERCNRFTANWFASSHENEFVVWRAGYGNTYDCIFFFKFWFGFSILLALAQTKQWLFDCCEQWSKRIWFF